jgi:hypothetical protein
MPSMPLFVFDLRQDTLANWMTLFAPTIRCALNACNYSGWVFVEWILPEGGHSTAFYFDGNRQVFFDPSTVLYMAADVDNHDPWDLLTQRHVWIPHSQNPVVQVVDNMSVGRGHKQPWQENVQSFFSSMEAMDPCDLEGCCTTVTILVVWLCLRYGCKDPQRMVNALRCVMMHMRTKEEGSVQDFLLKLRAWHQEMMRANWPHREFLSWLRIRARPGYVKCDYILPSPVSARGRDGLQLTFCDNECEDGWTWCREHGPNAGGTGTRDSTRVIVLETQQ